MRMNPWYNNYSGSSLHGGFSLKGRILVRDSRPIKGCTILVLEDEDKLIFFFCVDS